MKIFIAYAKQDIEIAKDINLALRNDHHEVFFDQNDLSPGKLLDKRIRKEIRDSDVFLFLISPDSVRDTCYARYFELTIARGALCRWSGLITMPAVVKPVPRENWPPKIQGLSEVSREEPVEVAIRNAIAKIKEEIGTDGGFKKWILVLVILTVVCTISIWPPKETLTLYTGQPGSTYNKIGKYLEQQLSRSSIGKRYKIKIVETHGSVQNCKEFGNSDQTSESGIRLGLFQLAAHRNTDVCTPSTVVYIAPLYDEITHLILRKEVFDAVNRIRKEDTPITPCLLHEIGLPMATGLIYSATHMIAKRLLECAKKHSTLYRMSFEEAQKSLTSPRNDLEAIEASGKSDSDSIQVAAAFFNQAAQSGFIKDAVANDVACILPLSGQDIDAARNDMKLKAYVAAEDDDFYKQHTCKRKGTKQNGERFTSLSSISVIAIRTPGNQESDKAVITEILNSIYLPKNFAAITHDITPGLFSCDEVNKRISQDDSLREDGGGSNVEMHQVAKDYFDRGCGSAHPAQ